MAESFVGLPPDSTGKKLRSISGLYGGVTVEEQVVRTAVFGGVDSIHFNGAFTNRAVNEWSHVSSYTVPVGYGLRPIVFRALSATAGYQARAIYARKFGSYNLGTNVFTDGGAAIAPGHMDTIFAVVTTALSAVATTLTLTYVNAMGTTGRTATIALAASLPVGARVEMTPATRVDPLMRTVQDTGVKDLTAVAETPSSLATGVVDFYGYDYIAWQRMTVANTVYESVLNPHSMEIPAGDIILMDSNSMATAPASIVQERSLSFQLAPV